MAPKISGRRVVLPAIDQQGIVGFFDGVEQGGSCGVGMVIRLSQSFSYRLKFSVGFGTNTKAKLLAL